VDLRKQCSMAAEPAGENNGADRALDRCLGGGRFALLLLILIAAAFPDVLFGWRTFFYRDFGIFGYPLAFYHRGSIWNGEIPLWNPLNNSGLPFLAQWNTMVFYPLTLIYILLPLSWALGLFCLAHLFLGGMGMFRLIEHWTNSRFGAAVAGLGFAFNGLTLSCLKWPNNIAALGWMPWVILLVSRIKHGGARSVISAAAAGAMQMLTGGPEIILLTWLLAIAGLIVDIGAIPVRQRRTKTGYPLASGIKTGVSTVDAATSQSASRLVMRFALMSAIVAAFSAVQLMPFFELLLTSQRNQQFSDTSWAMPWSGLANFIVPLFRTFASHQGVHAQLDQYWISSYYPGIGLLALALVGAWKNRRTKLLSVLCLLCIWLALGTSAGLYSLVREYVPGSNIVRFPIKFIVPVIFVICASAGFAVASLDLGERRKMSGVASRKRLWSDGTLALLIVGIGLLAYLLLIVMWEGKRIPDFVLRNAIGRAVVIGAFIAAFIGLLRSTSFRRSLTFAGAILALHWIDIMTHAPRLTPTIPLWVYEPGLAKTELKFNPAPTLGNARAFVSPWAEYRMNHLALTNAADDFLYSRFALFANANLLDNIPKVDGFFSLSIREENEVRGLLYSRTNASFPGLEQFLGVAQTTASGKLIEWSARTNYQSWITAGQRPVFVASSEELRAVTDPGFSPAEMVVLENGSQTRVAVTNRVQCDVLLRQWSAQRIRFETTAQEPSLVVVAQSWYRPWHAFVNGDETEIFRANHAFQALQVPAGRSVVEFVYKDRAFHLGALLSGISVLVSLAVWFRTGVMKPHTG
jgi:hypothetical protein